MDWVRKAVAALIGRPREYEARLFYVDARLVDDVAVFSCGCRFMWSRPDVPPKICAAHRAIIDAEVSA